MVYKATSKLFYYIEDLKLSYVREYKEVVTEKYIM